MKSTILILTAFLFLGAQSFSQVVINEVSAANFNDEQFGGDFEDWVELYNAGAAAADIGGFFLSDNNTNLTKFEIAAGTSIPPNGRLLFVCSGRDAVIGGQIHTNFKLKQTAQEEVVFSDPSQIILDEFNWPTPNQTNHSWGRFPEGTGDWKVFEDPTPDGANVAPSDGYAATPILSEESGFRPGPITLSMTSSTAGTEIRYTTDGSMPNAGSTLYNGPINLSTTTVVRAVAISTGALTLLPSFVETNTYFFGADQHEVLIVSVSGAGIDGGGFGGWAGGITAFELFDENGVLLDEMLGDSNEHGNDSNAYGQDGLDFIARDQMGYASQIEHQIFPVKSRDKFQRIILKAAANDNYSFEPGGAHIRDAYVHTLSQIGDLRMDERTSRACVMYYNGDYWGVYELREKIDDIDFTDYYYDQPRGFVDFMKTWGGTWAEYGDGQDFFDLRDFIIANDMSDDANYQFVKSQYNTGSLIDYFILNGYIVSADWLNWNTAWWRGRHPDGDKRKWRYVLWDMDASFGHYVNYTGVPSTGPDSNPCDPIDALGDPGGQGHVPIMNALFDNEEFYADYINRYADLSNSIFSCESMIHVLDSMINVIEPEMERQTQRWGGSVAGWQDNVQALRDFINSRCNDGVIGGLEDCLDIEAFDVTVTIDGPGSVNINTITISGNEQWDGVYFGGIPISMEAESLCGGVFVGWQINSGDLIVPDLTTALLEFELTSNLVLTAVFEVGTIPVSVVYDIEPSGAGQFTVDGTTISSTTDLNVNLGTNQTLQITDTAPFFNFSHWESVEAELEPDDEDLMITAQICQTDSIRAVFDEVENYALSLNLTPTGAGTVYLNGSLVSLPYSAQFETGTPITVETIPANALSQFDQWDSSVAGILANPTSTVGSFTLTQDVALTAEYTILIDYNLTVNVEPKGAGFVQVSSGLRTSDSATETLLGNTTYQLTASPKNEFVKFVDWKSEREPGFTSSALVHDIFLDQDMVYTAHFFEEEFVIFLPNSFSPNSDGLNDVFKPVAHAQSPREYSLLIFDRWGEVIFETNDWDKGWNGSLDGGEYYVQNGVYSYVLKAKSHDDEEYKEMSGTITVFR